MNLEGYTINHDKFYISTNTLLFNGVRDADKKNVMIKVLKNQHPSPDEILSFKHEYEIAQLFKNHENIVQVYALEKYENSYAIIMEKINFPTLDYLLKHEKKIKLDAFLDFAIEITSALGCLHQNNIIHKDVTPANILCNTTNNTIKLIDFGNSATLPVEHADIISLNMLNGTFAYLSPEQTGRMNRSIDARADFYSLGVTFYHMITGRLPFSANDPMKMVHCHIAVIPKSPHKIDSAIPKAVSNIIMKLIAKKAEDRYQNANGLIADLKICREQLQNEGEIHPFTLGKKDIFSRFRIPEKLYGRDTEVNILMDTYKLVVEGAVKLMLVAGYSGIGKTSLVHEIHKPITAQHGYFISGKFDELKQNIPYSSVIQAFKDFVKQILTESEERIEHLRKRILDAVGDNGDVLINLIPNLVAIIGPQPAVPVLNSTENLNRLSYTLQNFIKAIATEDSPLVIFLDDLQWADLPSFQILEILLKSPDCRYLFIIGAYRNNEVSAAHPLMLMLEKLNKQDIFYQSINLGPLKLETATELIADALYQDRKKVQKLSTICYNKSGGNPFFLIQLLLSLNKENLIEFNVQRNKWVWDINKIMEQKIADNVVQLMVNSIGKLPPANQKVMQLAAFIGNRFELALLSSLCEQDPEIVLMDLQEALKEGYIVSYGENFYANSFYYAHDRIQQAAYSMINVHERNDIHIKLAHLLYNNNPNEKLSEVLFDLVNNYNIVINSELPNSINQEEKKLIATLNLQACKMAKATAAFEPAFKYAKNGIKCLDDDCWKTDYTLIFSLYKEATSCAHLSLQFDLMEFYAEIALKHTKNILDEIKIVQIQILSNILQMKQPKAVALFLNILKRTGISTPNNPNMLHVVGYIIRTKILLSGKDIPNLIKLPAMQDETNRAVIRIMVSVYSAVFQTQPNLFPILVCIGLELSLKQGNTLGTALIYTLYGLLLCGVLGQLDKGYQFGELGLKLVDKLSDIGNKPRVTWTYYTFIKHWKEPIHNYLSIFIENYHQGISEGDIEFSCYNIAMNIHYGILIGFPLKELILKMNNYKAQMVKSITPYNYASIAYQAALNMVKPTEHPELLVGEAYDEISILPTLLAANDKSGLFLLYISKSLLAFHFDKNETAIELLKICDTYQSGSISSFFIVVFYYYKALALLKAYSSASWLEQYKTSITVRLILKKFKKWLKSSPANFTHKYLLLEAEFQYHIKGNLIKAATLYDEALESARKNEFLNDEALANELAAKFYLAQNHNKIALVYMKDAKYCYLLWGAEAKVAQLDSEYIELLRENIVPLKMGIDNVLVSTTISGSESLDISSIQKFSIALSNTIVLSSLLNKLMYIIIENAGAEKSYLLLNKEGIFTIEAEGGIDLEANVLQSLKPTSDMLPMTLINYVIHSSESVVLNNAVRSDSYLNDPYIINKKPISILVMPLINQGFITGILYLENNLTEGAFTEDRIRVLNLLSSQIAISIDNARLYENAKALNISFERFVPEDFLSLLKKTNITEVALGDHIEDTMTVLFVDIRNFTTLSEKMTPEENFDFINSFLKIMGPIIRKHHGFVDKYIGDAIMAIYPGDADDALICAIEMQMALKKFNKNQSQQEPIKMGIGINTGMLMLGTVGEEHRMSATVMSDAVNIASRVESLTKIYNVPILITEATYLKLTYPSKYNIEMLDSVVVQGKTHSITLYKVIIEPQVLAPSNM